MQKVVAFLFPGQGRIPDSLPPITEETEALYQLALARDLPLKTWIATGAVDELSRTENAQPALLIDSLARDAALRDRGVVPAFVAGHSLGEYAALTSAKVLPAPLTLALVIERGRLMSEVSGSMAAIVKLDLETVRSLCDKLGPQVVVANHNSPAQIVISGQQDAVDQVVAAANRLGGRGIPLAVSGPFHSPFMAPAQEALVPQIEQALFEQPSVPVVSSVSGAVEHDATSLKELLLHQMTSCVRWVDVIQCLEQAGVTHAVEVGSDEVLSNLGRRISKRITFVRFEEAHHEGV